MIDANQLMASTLDVVLQEHTQGACVATQTLLITQGSINADASIGHQRMLVQILLLFALATIQEDCWEYTTGLAVIIARIQQSGPVMELHGKEAVLKNTVALVDKTLVEDESSITLTVAAVLINRLVQGDVVAKISLGYVGGGWTASKDAVLHQPHSHETKGTFQNFLSVVTVFVQMAKLQTLVQETAATK